MAFGNIRQWANSLDDGRYHTATFRKTVSSAATLANDFIDYTYFSGNPTANFYASEPLVSAEIEQNKGILIANVDGQYLQSIMVMAGAASGNTTTADNQRLLLADYLLYYPFIDTDAVGEVQTLTNSVTLPRYSYGQVMAVGQSASSTIGQFTINYTNQDGVSGRVSQNTFTKVISGGGVLVSSTSNVIAGSQPFIQLQAGDSGVKSIESVTFTAGGGGLMALVIVQPIEHFIERQSARRATSPTIDSFGSATHKESLIHMQPKEIKNGAVLGVIGLGNNGSLASSTLVGMLNTVWRN